MCLVRALLWVADCWYLLVSSHGGRSRGSLSATFMKILIPLVRALPSWSYHLPKGLLPNTSTCKYKSAYGFWGRRARYVGTLYSFKIFLHAYKCSNRIKIWFLKTGPIGGFYELTALKIIKHRERFKHAMPFQHTGPLGTQTTYGRHCLFIRHISANKGRNDIPLFNTWSINLSM